MIKRKEFIMMLDSTNFLRLALTGLGVVALGLAGLILPTIHSGWALELPDAAGLRYPFILVLAATLVPFFVALTQAAKILKYIDRGTAFSQQSVSAIRTIKHAAVAFSALYVLALPFIYFVAEADDAPGLIVVGMGFVAAPIVVAVLSAVVQRLLQDAIDIKSENDLTV